MNSKLHEGAAAAFANETVPNRWGGGLLLLEMRLSGGGDVVISQHLDEFGTIIVAASCIQSLPYTGMTYYILTLCPAAAAAQSFKTAALMTTTKTIE